VTVAYVVHNEGQDASARHAGLWLPGVHRL